MYSIDYFRLFIKNSLDNLENKEPKEILKIYSDMFLHLKKKGFKECCIEKYGEYKSICIIEILKLISLDYLLINDNFENTQGINVDKINNLREALVTLNLLVG